MLTFISVPTLDQLMNYSAFGSGATDTGVSLADLSSGVFNELVGYALIVTGLIIGALFVRFIVMGGLKGAVQKLIGRGRRGGRRRRR